MAEISILNGYKIKDKKAIRFYNSVADMKADTTLKENMHVKTTGYYEKNDGGCAEYIIRAKTQNDVEDNGKIHFLNNNLVAELIIKDDTINIKELGISNNDDVSSVINNNSKYITDINIKLNKSQMFNLNNYSGDGSVQWKDFESCDDLDGIIPISRKNDEIYCSMNLPNTGNSLSNHRNNGYIYNNIESNTFRILPILGIYINTNKNIPNNFILKLGKIKLFGYRESTKKWEILTQNKYPTCKLYALPWTVNNTKSINNISFNKYDDSIELHLTPQDFAGDSALGIESRVVHCWGSDFFPKTNDYLDIKYFSACVEASCYTETGEDLTDVLLMTNAIDSRLNSTNGTVRQFNYSSLQSIDANNKRYWSTTIPNNEYEDNWYNELNYLMDLPFISQHDKKILTLPGNENHGTSAYIKLLSIPIKETSFFVIFNLKVNIGSSNNNDFLYYNLRIQRSSGTTHVDFKQASHTNRSGVIVVIENETDNTYDIYLTNIPNYSQTIVEIQPIIYSKTSVEINYVQKLLREYKAYSSDYDDLWLTETPQGTSYSNS